MPGSAGGIVLSKAHRVLAAIVLEENPDLSGWFCPWVTMFGFKRQPSSITLQSLKALIW